MTSNQLQYWANKERERANRVVEAETHRANVAKEDLTRASQALEAIGLDIKKGEAATDVWRLVAQYGNAAASQLTQQQQQEILSKFDISGSITEKNDPASVFYSIWDELKRLASTIFGSKGLSALF